MSKAGELADKRQKTWLDFIGKQVLPILDGIIDGKNHTSILVDELREQYQESESKISEWYNTYLTLSSTILTMLNDLACIPDGYRAWRGKSILSVMNLLQLRPILGWRTNKSKRSAGMGMITMRTMETGRRFALHVWSLLRIMVNSESNALRRSGNEWV